VCDAVQVTRPAAVRCRSGKSRRTQDEARARRAGGDTLYHMHMQARVSAYETWPMNTQHASQHGPLAGLPHTCRNACRWNAAGGLLDGRCETSTIVLILCSLVGRSPQWQRPVSCSGHERALVIWHLSVRQEHTSPTAWSLAKIVCSRCEG
jgi:hypothetical protein